MLRLTFALGILLWAATAAVFLRNFLNRGQPASLVCAVAFLGWPVLLAREMQWLPRPLLSFLIAAALPMGLLGLLIVLNAERQRR